jgi:CubicO group peptidase (beta-lactamase class C family)
MDTEREGRIKELLSEGVRDDVYPGAVLLVAREGKIIFFHEVGQRSLIPPDGPMTKDTIFDLASLTKPLATTLAVMKCVDDGRIDLDQPLESLLPNTVPKDKKTITPRQILAHCAGFEDWKPFYLNLVEHEPANRKTLLRTWIMGAPLSNQPGERTIYSDLGFMVLEWVIEECTGSPLDIFLDRNFFSPLSLKRMFFNEHSSPIRFGENQYAATEDCPWRKKVMRGLVHDENAYALGGYSGHAGLFGTAEDAYILVDLLRSHFLGGRQDYFNTGTVKTFFTRQDLVEGSTWALGWDTPSPQDSSSGNFFSSQSVGHLGYTGTSLWLDIDKDVVVIFLSNRIHPSRKNEKIRAFRPVLHDMIIQEVISYGGD